MSLRNIRIRSSATGRLLLNCPSLELFAGDRIAITGASGSGKSLLLASMTGRWPVGLTVEGERVTSLTRIGMIPQRGIEALHPLVPLLTQLRRVTGADLPQAREVLRSVGLTDETLYRRRPAELSGGQAQRAAVALATLSGSRLILADEPTSALDHETRDHTVRLLERLATTARTLVVATHDPAVAAALATRWIEVDSGEVTEFATETETRRREALPLAIGARA